MTIFVVVTAVWNIAERRRQRRMAAGRIALSDEQFVGQLTSAGVDRDIARFVLDEATPYYFEPLKPDPNDHWDSTMRADPDDLEDITAKFWKSQGWAEPSRKDPVMIPQNPTLLEYARWLQSHRSMHN